MRNVFLSIICLPVLCLATNSLVLADGNLVELRVFPKDVSLTTKRDFQSVVVQGYYDNGLTADLTEQAEWKMEDASLVSQEKNVFRPAADGETQLTVSVGEKSVTVPVKVARASDDRPVSFKLDVMPVLTKSGCNTGSCHGAARGKDGFNLSLFGYDPDGDHFRITREQPGRRVNLAIPEASLLVEKGAGVVPHTGGKRFDLESKMCQTIVEWIANGTPTDPKDQATCTSIEMYPKQAVLDGTGESQRTVVIATYSDGTVRDVTSLAAFTTSNETAIAVDEHGLVTAGERGEGFVMARFDVHTVGSQFLSLPKGLQYEEQPETPANEIDVLVAQKLKKLRLHPSELCSDEEFLRRVSIDLIGLTPTYEEYTAFLADSSPDKRARKIDELLDRKEFTEVWVSKWAEWLMMRSSNQVSQKSIFLYYQWLVEQIANNVPMDEMVREILSSSGGTFTTPQTNFYEIERDQLKVAENVAQIFMGMRIQCAQCHNHPFDRWTQDEYYDFAAFFSQVGRKRGEDEREQIIFNRGGGEVKHSVTGQNATPTFLGGPSPDTKGKDRRVVVANWLASNENPFFAKNFANRIWHHFFGIGIVEPIDDFRISNPASNPELLDELAQRLTDYDYDMRKLIRDICNSNTYQRTTRRNESNMTDELNFAHQNIRRIKAESMLDVISHVTGTKDDFAKLPVGARAVQIADGATSTYFLTTFGRATRETACSCEVKMEPTLSQALHLLNGDTVNNKMRQGNQIKTLLDQGLSPEQVIERLYIVTLCRKPTAEELESLSPLYAEGTNVQQGLEDAYWALLNSREFLFNH
ncbi:hypothetical protein KOR42_16250 [Thalassoglobus neptunius]|uniref:Bacterial Ig-like domain (Group 2) n=1 Tax=Thalassoglobus neptunius TaxID=1938619 RepID=A0A5C5X5Q4_9PLAN|nr:DUF1549 and DUF1553 domain-containing protein [Thalassoglobus neptunius]TWT58254.1 hypothetical protein KOR42_16250 [Thalassoglobus neptunius]